MRFDNYSVAVIYDFLVFWRSENAVKNRWHSAAFKRRLLQFKNRRKELSSISIESVHAFHQSRNQTNSRDLKLRFDNQISVFMDAANGYLHPNSLTRFPIGDCARNSNGESLSKPDIEFDLGLLEEVTANPPAASPLSYLSLPSQPHTSPFHKLSPS